MNDNKIIKWMPYARRAAYGFWLKSRLLDQQELESAATYAVVEAVKKYDGSTPFEGYCRTMIRRRLIDHARRMHGRKWRKPRRAAISLDECRCEDVSLRDLVPDHRAESLCDTTNADMLDDVFKGLSQRERNVIVMRLNGQQFAEIANVLGISQQRCWQIWAEIAGKIAKRFGVPKNRVANCFSGRNGG